MSKITKIEMAGYHSFQQPTTLELAPLTVLIGANGAGKSNTLQAFEDFGRFGSQGAPVRRTLEDPMRIKVWTEEDTWEVRIPDDRNEELQAQARPGWAADAGGWRVLACPEIIARETGPPVDNNQPLARNGWNLPAYLNRMKKEEPNGFDLVQKTLRLAVPEVRNLDTFEATLHGETKCAELSWADADGAPRNQTELSAGTYRFLALAALLLGPRAWLPSIILLDEPETSLNPYAVTLLGAMLKSASAQTTVLATTQSPILLDELNVEDVVTIERSHGRTRFYRHTQHDVETLIKDHSLGELWQKNVLGGRR